MSEQDQGKQEIVIVRRRGGDSEDGHHGGVWKIAYADFMTAMMAFFLVMWLVNAANEDAKASLASYFNPIRLVDEKPTDRGMEQSGEAGDGAEQQPRSPSKGLNEVLDKTGEGGDDQNATAGDSERYSEADYFENPYSVLSMIALETGRDANISAAGEGGASTSGPATGASGGEAYRDPFDPDFWSAEVEIAAPLQEVGETAEDGVSEQSPADGDDRAASAVIEGEAVNQDDTDEASPATATRQAEAEALRDDILAALGDEVEKIGDGLSVVAAEDGLLISLTDQLDYGMFNVGSAVPRRDLVVAMERIGNLLAERQGRITIRGHTDGRPFRNAEYDNWRLSMARAHSAYFMLVRGGLAEERVRQVSGFADRELKVADDPFADANRRIEIFLQPASRPVTSPAETSSE